ncbi:Chromodomain-helicase-DNA-binding protein 1-like [Varanus komodoensis]|nr:Chromodomain-helicase-DNA-binding protein 1-like [Varanus komodoensis]
MDSTKRQKDTMPEDEPLRSEGVQCATGKEQRASTSSDRKNEATGSMPKGHSVADVTGGERRVRRCKDLYSIGTWNVRSMNQGKLDVIKHEMTRLSIDILGISELKWTGMGEFKSDDHQDRVRSVGVLFNAELSLEHHVQAVAEERFPSASAGIQLRPYQMEGVNWLTQCYGTWHGCILGDEMGLGKTCQAISLLVFLSGRLNKRPFLILCPLSVLNNWEEELKRFSPSLSFMTYSGGKEKRAELQQDLTSNHDFHILLTNYEVCLRDAAFLKRKVDSEGHCFQDKWKLEYFFTEIRNNCVCLICQETVAVFMEFNIKRHYQTKHAIYNKLTGNKRGKKLKELEAALTAQQRFFITACESNENATKASYEVATLIAKHCKPFTEGEFIKDCMVKMVEKICPEKKQEFANVCLARNTVVRRIEDVSSDNKRQLEAKGVEFDFFPLACNESTDASDTAQLLIFLRGVDNDMNAEYGDVVYHNEARWLSRGSALQRFYSLREEIGQFLAKKGQPMPELSDPVWLADFGFLVDITRHLNMLNTSLQGQNPLVSQLYSHIKAFGTKLLLFQRHLSQTQPNTAHFPSLQEIMTSFPQNNMSAQIRRYEADISSLAEEFQQRFRDFAAIEKEIIELQCDAECRSRHQQLPLVTFYRQLDKDRFQEI